MLDLPKLQFQIGAHSLLIKFFYLMRKKLIMLIINIFGQLIFNLHLMHFFCESHTSCCKVLLLTYPYCQFLGVCIFDFKFNGIGADNILFSEIAESEMKVNTKNRKIKVISLFLRFCSQRVFTVNF